MVETVTQRRVPAGPIEKPAGAVASVFDAGRQAKPKRTYNAMAIDPSAVVIKSGVPLPPAGPHARSNGSLALLQRMKAGDMCELPHAKARTVVSAAKKAGIKVAVRRLSDETSGLWRL